MNNFLLRLARPLAFLLGIAVAFLTFYTYVLRAEVIIHNPALVAPNELLWTAAQLESTLAGLGLSGNFYVLFSLGMALNSSLPFLICGWLILLRKNRDWFGLYLAMVMMIWAIGNGALNNVSHFFPWLVMLETYLSWLTLPSLFSLLYVFPSGHVIPRWARWFVWGLGLYTAYGLVITFLNVQPLNSLFEIVFMFTVLIVGGYAQVYRYRHAEALERQQIKWVALALVMLVTIFIILVTLQNFTGLRDPQQSGLTAALIYEIVSLTIGSVFLAMIPVSIVLSVLRYRLWDIDVIIRKTLVYGVLTATLALVFFGVVTLFQSLFQAVSGQQSAIGVVLSTLAIAALFNPLRQRIQNGIDRRFFRKKYNAEQALARFTVISQNETDIEQLSAELQAVVQETMQPEGVILWLRKG